MQSLVSAPSAPAPGAPRLEPPPVSPATPEPEVVTGRSRRFLAGLLFVVHGLAHASAGVWATDLGPAWFVTALWWMAMGGFVAAGFGLWGTTGLRKVWEPVAVGATVASLVLLELFGHIAFTAGIAVDVAVLVLGLRWGESALMGGPRDGVRAPHPVRHWLASALQIGFLAYLSLVVLLRPWQLQWGSTPDERAMRVLGDNLVPVAHYRMDRAVTIHAPADSVWPWLAQMGQDRGGFYSYAALERLVGDQVTNADRIHPEWQQRRVGDLVRGAQPDYLGGRLGRDIGWRIVDLSPGRGMVLGGWGAFVLHPVDATTTRLHVRVRGPGTPSFTGTLLGPLGVLVFEPAHFVMERRMLLGIKERAERIAAR